MGQIRFPGPATDPIQRIGNHNFDELYAGAGTSGTIYCVSPAGDDANDGLSWQSPLLTIQAAVDKTGYYNGDRVFIAPGAYDETVTITMDHAGLTLVGCGNRGDVAIAATTEAAVGALVRGNDVTFVNLGVAGEETAAYSLSFTGDRFRAYSCKLEGSLIAVLAKAGTAAQHDAGTDGSAADFLFVDCESAWTAKGFVCQSSTYGAVTQGRISAHRFHDCVTVCLGETDTAGIGAVRDLMVDGCFFDNAEDGTPPTDYIDLNSVGSTGFITGCALATPTNEADVIQLAAGVLWVANATEAGISTARPS